MKTTIKHFIHGHSTWNVNLQSRLRKIAFTSSIGKQLISKILLLVISSFFITCSKDSSNNINKTPSSSFAGKWVGTYIGDDYGTWDCVINADGNLTGSALSTVYDSTYSIIGNVSNSGNFTAMLGSVSSGSTFSGTFMDSTASGTWINKTITPALNGTWKGVKR